MWKTFDVETAVDVAVNVADVLRARAAGQPDATAMIDRVDAETGTISWRELDDRVDGVVAGLTSVGLLAGQRIALVGDNTGAFVVAYLAALRAGLVAVPLDASDEDAEIAQNLIEVGARVVWSDRRDRDLGDRETLELTGAGLDGLVARGRDLALPSAPPPDPESLAVLLRTTGTSGPSKVVMLSHRALLAHLAAVSAYGITDAQTTLLGVMPFSHAFGLNTILGGWLACGGRLVLVAGGARALLGAVEQEQVNLVPVTPRLLFELMSVPGYASSFAGVRTVVSVAAPLPWRLGQDFTEATGLRVERGYGLTEAGPGVAATVGYDILGPAHVGRALPGVEIMITTDQQAAAGEAVEPGSILVRGANLFSGYWPTGAGGPDADGWFDTGDLGYLAGEDLFLVDRARELLVINGFTVYPSEVEQVIRELPGVRSAAALGLRQGDGAQRLLVFVAGTVSADEVAAFCATRLAPFKQPAQIRLVDDLPRGLTGRVQRHVLRRWAETETS